MKFARLWLALSALSLAGCGGPSIGQEILGVVGAVPILYVLSAGLLWAFEKIRNAPDRASQPIGAEVGGCAVVLSVASVAVVMTTPNHDTGLIVIAAIALGALELGIAAAVWRARLKAPYASRVLVALRASLVLGLPAYVLARADSWERWSPGSPRWFADQYITVLSMLIFFGGLYVGPVVVLGVLIESIARRRK